jgi:hypothetical protein
MLSSFLNGRPPELELEPAALGAHPAALPLLLVLVGAGVALPGTGLDVVEPHVLVPARFVQACLQVTEQV